MKKLNKIHGFATRQWDGHFRIRPKRNNFIFNRLLSKRKVEIVKQEYDPTDINCMFF